MKGSTMSEPNQSERISRRNFLQGSAAIAGAALAGPALTQAQSTNRRPGGGKRPNLIFFYNEGQRADALSLAGNPLLKTPNQDRIGREGVYFNNSFCTNALCSPARATALTGLYSHNTGGMTLNTQYPFPSDIPLFTDLLHQAGYDVAMVGKAHAPNGVRERYWDYYCAFNAPVTDYFAPRYFEGRKGKFVGHRGIEGAEQTLDAYYYARFEGQGQAAGRRGQEGGGADSMPKKAAGFQPVWADDFFTDRALDWLKEDRGDRPFCLLLWQQSPHAPYFRPRRYANEYNGVPIPVPSTFDDDAKGYPGKPRAFADAFNKIGIIETTDAVRSLEELTKDYYAGLMGVDDNIGRVMQYLESSGQLDDTALLLSSDHGYFLGEWRCFDKRFMHEPSLRTPTMIRYPKMFKAGTKVDEMVLNLDFAPTLLELAGVHVPAAMQGKSLVGLAQGHNPEWRKDFLYEYFDWPGTEEVRPHRGIRTERYKYIHYFLEPQEYELYDLKDDPGELNNLQGDPAHAGLRLQLAARLEELRRETGDTTDDQTL